MFLARGPIAPGDEITINYGAGLVEHAARYVHLEVRASVARRTS